MGRTKSSAIGKLVKKFSTKGGKSDKSLKTEVSNGDKKGLTGSNSNLDGFLQRVKRSQSMEMLQLATTPVLSNGRKVTTPTPSPLTTPKVGKSIFRARRNSESDLENRECTCTCTRVLYELIF